MCALGLRHAESRVSGSEPWHALCCGHRTALGGGGVPVRDLPLIPLQNQSVIRDVRAPGQGLIKALFSERPPQYWNNKE